MSSETCDLQEMSFETYKLTMLREMTMLSDFNDNRWALAVYDATSETDDPYDNRSTSKAIYDTNKLLRQIGLWYKRAF